MTAPNRLILHIEELEVPGRLDEAGAHQWLTAVAGELRRLALTPASPNRPTTMDATRWLTTAFAVEGAP